MLKSVIGMTVRLSVCMLHCGIISTSRGFHHRVVQGLGFSRRKVVQRFGKGSTRGYETREGLGKIANLQLYHAISFSETVYTSAKVTI